jgi:hypothetical protein
MGVFVGMPVVGSPVGALSGVPVGVFVGYQWACRSASGWVCQ